MISISAAISIDHDRQVLVIVIDRGGGVMEKKVITSDENHEASEAQMLQNITTLILDSFGN